jgi:hypothetical protein
VFAFIVSSSQHTLDFHLFSPSSSTPAVLTITCPPQVRNPRSLVSQPEQIHLNSTDLYQAVDIMSQISNGDIILVVGSDGDKVNLQTSSHFLKRISDVFRAMLNSPMREGESLRNKGDAPVEILLPSDNPQAMAHVLEVLYGAGASINSLQSKYIKEMCILANKYAMDKHLRYFGWYWFRLEVKFNEQAETM